MDCKLLQLFNLSPLCDKPGSKAGSLRSGLRSTIRSLPCPQQLSLCLRGHANLLRRHACFPNPYVLFIHKHTVSTTISVQSSCAPYRYLVYQLFESIIAITLFLGPPHSAVASQEFANITFMVYLRPKHQNIGACKQSLRRRRSAPRHVDALLVAMCETCIQSLWVRTGLVKTG
jgi:hypothetical protein